MKELHFVKIFLFIGIITKDTFSDKCIPCTWTSWGKCQPNNIIERNVCCPADIVSKLNTTGKATVAGCVKSCHDRRQGDVSTSDKMTRTCHYGKKSTTVKTTTLPTTTTKTTLLPTTTTKATTPPSTTSKATLSATTIATTTAPKTTTTAAKLTVPQTATSTKVTTSATSKAKTTPIFPTKHSSASTPSTPSPPVSTTTGNATAKGRIQGPSGKEESSSNPLPGAIGGVIGVLVLAAIASGIFYFLWKRKKRGKDEKVHPSTPDVREAETKDLPMENGAPPSDHRV